MERITEINPIVKPVFDQLEIVLKRLDAIQASGNLSTPKRIAFPDFCKQENISRPTGYSWAERGLIKLEKIGGRQYVVADSIIITKKYQRDPIAA